MKSRLFESKRLKKKKRKTVINTRFISTHAWIANVRFDSIPEKEVRGIVSWMKNILGKLCFEIQFY